VSPQLRGVAVQVQRVRGGEGVLVTVGGGEGDPDLRILEDGTAADLQVAAGGAEEPGLRADVSQDLLDGVLEGLCVRRLEPLPLFRMCAESVDAVNEGGAGGLVARDDLANLVVSQAGLVVLARTSAVRTPSSTWSPCDDASAERVASIRVWR
jgi:hypothetical protein